MEAIGYVVLFVYLLVMSVYDIRKGEIQLTISLLAALVLLMRQLSLVPGGGIGLSAAFPGVLVGVVLIVVSILTRGEIGIGDGIVFMVSGLVFGIYENGVLLFLSLVFTAFVSAILMVAKHVGRKYTLPFVPFVFIGYGVMCIWKIFS